MKDQVSTTEMRPAMLSFEVNHALTRSNAPGPVVWEAAADPRFQLHQLHSGPSPALSARISSMLCLTSGLQVNLTSRHQTQRETCFAGHEN